MGEPRQLEFFLLRYVPNVVKEEFVNIGLVLLEPVSREDGNYFADVRFTRSWRGVRCLDPQADVEMLMALEQDIRGRLADRSDRAALLKMMEDSFSNAIQLAPMRSYVAEDPALEMETLASIYLESTKFTGERLPSGRQRILRKMREAFKQARVEQFVMPVPVAPYTKAGDPFQFDFGYRIGGEIKLFQAVSLKGNVDGAILLASRYPRIAPVMAKVVQATPGLTAVIDDDLDRGNENVQFALSTMEDEKIRIAAAAEMPMIAEVARRELRA
jgi:Protein of unknown function (DUF3037)